MSNTESTETRRPMNSINWNELRTTDPAGAIRFYTDLFGWETEKFPTPQHEYTMLKNGGKLFGGVMSAKEPGAHPHWVNYVGVENLEAIIDKATKLGAKTLLPPTPIGDSGRIAILADPQGAPIGLHEYKG